MKAIVFREYGTPDVLSCEEVPDPRMGDDDLLIRVRAVCASSGDCELRRLDIRNGLFRPVLRLLMGWRRPRRPFIPGMYLAGEIEAVGSNVKNHRPGERVFGTSGMRMGACAEKVAVPANAVVHPIPDNLSFEEAAASPLGGMNALHFIHLATLTSGDHILINGAGGGIGTFSIQLAKLAGARVTAVDHGAKLDLLRSIGADEVIDYTRETFTQRDQTWDAILDIAGTSDYGESLRRLVPGGRYLLGNPLARQMLRSRWTNLSSNRKVIHQFAAERRGELRELAGLLGAGGIRGVVDRTYPLAETADAHRYVESGAKLGNVIIVP